MSPTSVYNAAEAVVVYELLETKQQQKKLNWILYEGQRIITTSNVDRFELLIEYMDQWDIHFQVNTTHHIKQENHQFIISRQILMKWNLQSNLPFNNIV